MTTQNNKNSPFSVAPKSKGSRLENGLNVSSYAPEPYNIFSPFSYKEEYHIPVPGQEVFFSKSVEGIWQGLKIINGGCDLSFLYKRPTKRRGKVEGHSYGDRILDIEEARRKIYMPSYFFHLNNNIGEGIKEKILESALEQSVCFFDVEENIDPSSPEPLAHSYFLKEYFDKYLVKRKKRLQKNLDNIFNINVEPAETLAEPATRAVKLFNSSKEVDKLLMKLVLNEPQEESKRRYYARVREEIGKL